MMMYCFAQCNIPTFSIHSVSYFCSIISWKCLSPKRLIVVNICNLQRTNSMVDTNEDKRTPCQCIVIDKRICDSVDDDGLIR